MGVDDWIAREGHICPKCKAPDCRRWEAEQKMSLHLPEWKQRELDDECAFRVNACPTCKGKCCRDTDFGYRVRHMAAECYQHECEDCRDGQVPPPDPRDAELAKLRDAIAAWPEVPHAEKCGEGEDWACNCGVAHVNHARHLARIVAGLEKP